MAVTNPAFDGLMSVDGRTTPVEPTSPVAESTALSAAAQKFQTCRWRRPAKQAIPEGCAHRDVLPITGLNGFDPEAWCPDCTFYKLRRTPRKREYNSY